jgi:hypothetical protein
MGAERRERQKRAQEKRALQDRSPVAPEVSSPQDKTNYGLGNGADTSKNLDFKLGLLMLIILR